METFKIDATDETPFMLFDNENHTLEIKGISYPEDPWEFFMPAFEWLDNYFDGLENTAVSVKIDITYFHSGSTEILLYFFDKLSEQVKKGNSFSVQWLYKDNERDMLEQGEDLQRDFYDLAFEFVEVKN